GETAVSGTVSAAGTTATFTPAAALAPATDYTATLTTDVRDLAGNRLAAPLVWQFRTAAGGPRSWQPATHFVSDDDVPDLVADGAGGIFAVWSFYVDGGYQLFASHWAA